MLSLVSGRKISFYSEFPIGWALVTVYRKNG